MQLLLHYRIPLFRHVSFTILGLYNRLLTSDQTDCEKKHFENRNSNTNYFIVIRVRSMGNSREKYLIEFFLNWSIQPNRPTDETDSMVVSYLLSNSRIWVSCSHTHTHCAEICITVFIDNERLSIHEHRQNALMHT